MDVLRKSCCTVNETTFCTDMRQLLVVVEPYEMCHEPADGEGLMLLSWPAWESVFL